MEKMFTKKNYSGYLDNDSSGIDYSKIKKSVKKYSTPDFSKIFGKSIYFFNTVIISDLHLGSKVTRAHALLHFLETVQFKRLIINGDVFDSINMKRLNRHHWKILSLLRKLTDKENETEVIWIRGNHDGYSDLISQLLGIQFYEEYIFNWNNKRVLVFHGDIFDKFITNYPLITDIADFLYRTIIYLDPATKKIGRWIKRNSKTFIRNTEKVRKGAVQYAKHRQADIVICGHTHYMESTVDDKIQYLNPGSWTDSPTHFVGITEDQIQVVKYID